MGNQNYHKTNLRKLDRDFICPKCKFKLKKGDNLDKLNKHISDCIVGNNNNVEVKKLQSNIQNKQIKKQWKYKDLQSDYIYMKIPTSNQQTTFRWQKVPKIFELPNNLMKMNESQIRKLNFQVKYIWFSQQLELLRINWREGCSWLHINREDILMSSLLELQKIKNLHGQMKIYFMNEKVNDAGGLLRQWMHLVIKQIFTSDINLFMRTNTNNCMYKFKMINQQQQYFNKMLAFLLGRIIGKAIFQRITISSYLDRTLLRQLCGQSLCLQDIWGYDQSLYSSWKYLLNETINQQLELNFTICHKNCLTQQIEEIQLIQNGKSIIVTNQNKNIYINLCIQYYCNLSIQSYLSQLKSGLYEVIPQPYLSIFQPWQLQMILYGIPFIDYHEWHKNTTYRGHYNENSIVIIWFWQLVYQLSQFQLANLLHFCTGSYRTPIQGFNNRGNCCKFMIQSALFDKQNPYPKGHTCFNRLELPEYPTFQLTKIYLYAIVNNNFDGIFGLD